MKTGKPLSSISRVTSKQVSSTQGRFQTAVKPTRKGSQESLTQASGFSLVKRKTDLKQS